MPGAKKNLCLAMNGKRAEINNISKHVVLCSSRLSVLSYFSFYCCSIASPRSAWHCMPALRALRSPAILDRHGRALASQNPPKIAPRFLKSRFGNVLGASWTVSAPSWSVLALSWAVLAPASSVLALSWAVLAPSWPILAPSWRHLETSWTRLGLPKTSQDSSKTPPKI